jgi:ABC-type long-subunit fatty acid transport system fused permease/ATPase subunit
MFTKKYFQDRTILFLNFIVLLGATVNVVATVLRIDTTQAVSIIRYQVSLGLAGFQRADVIQLYSFAIMALIISITAIVVSAKMHRRRRNLSVLVLSLAIVALFFNLIVSGAILNLQ